MKRREFLMSAAAAAVVARGRVVAASQAANGKLGRVGVSSQNFDATIKLGSGAGAGHTLDPLDLPQMVADTFGVHNLELRHAHFTSTEDAYLKDLRARVERAKSQIIQISADFYNTTASSSAPTRLQGIDLARRWIDHAKVLGCPRLMVNAGPVAENMKARAIEALQHIAEYAKAQNVSVSIDNRDTGVAPMPPAPPLPPAPPPPDRSGAAPGATPARGRRSGGGGGGNGGRGQAPPPPPATWQVIAELAKASGVFVTPNIAGFPSDAERSAGLKTLFSLSNDNCHVSTNAGTTGLAAAIAISKDTGYKGLYTIVTEPAGGDPAAATRAVLNELLTLI